MKILILANNDGGLYHFRKELLEQLITDGHEVYVSVPDGEFVPEIRKIGCRVARTVIARHGTNPVGDLKLLATYCRYINSVRPDIVFTYTIKPNIYGGMACELFRVPYVANITGLGTAVENKGALQFVTLTLYRMALHKAQTVFFQNEANERFFADRRIAQGRHKMLPGSGVNLNDYALTPYPEERNNQKQQVPEKHDQAGVQDEQGKTLKFVFVGRLMKEKGIDQYLDAAKTIRKKYPQTEFHICGGYEEAYENKLKKLQADGTIVYHGSVKDMRPIYQQIHCTVHPTYYPEGLSNVLLESAATGRPIITTNRPGCREVIEDGVNGYLVWERDSEDLIAKIEQFIQLPWEEKRRMGIAGRKKAEAEFDRKIVVKKYMNELMADEKKICRI